MFGETLHCGELIKRLNDALGRKANNTLMCDDLPFRRLRFSPLSARHPMRR